MLHSSQAVIRQTYFFDNATNPSLKHPVLDESSIELSPPTPLEALDPKELISEAPEQTNFGFAKHIAASRNALISNLAQLPIASLWLITKLEQHINTEKEELQGITDSSEYRERLSFLYLDTVQSLTQHSLVSFEVQSQKQKLSEHFENYHFSAEQLKELATFVFFAYYTKIQQTRNFISQPKVQEIIVSKLNKISKQSALQQRNDLKQLQAIWIDNTGLEQLILPADDDEHTLLSQVINLESIWLTARQQLASANNRLVLYLANQYKGGFLDFNDLVQEGQTGLLKAVDRFDYQKGFQFSTYAAYWIRQAISRALIRNERVVRLPFGQMANISKVFRVKETLFLKHGFEPSVDAIAEHSQLSEAEINNILLISQSATSLDTPVGEDENTMTKADFIEQQIYEPALNTIFRKELTNAITSALSTLTSKEVQVIKCRFGLDVNQEMTLEEIGNELNLTRERVRQIQVAAIKKLKKHFGDDLKNFM